MSKSSVGLIVAVGNQNQIGKNNQLLWRLPEDLKKFKSITMGKPLIMGRKTFESIGRPLPGRPHLILSHKLSTDEMIEKYPNSDIHVFKDLMAAILGAEELYQAEEVMIIGGGEVYRQAIDESLVDKIYISKVDFNGDADTFFPKLDLNFWQVVESEEFEAVEGRPAWRFEVLKRVQ